jgi:hypothetical protein
MSAAHIGRFSAAAARLAQRRTRQTVELVSYETFFSDDNWQTVWKRISPGHARVVADKTEADRIRYIAVVKYGGGRDDEQVAS